MRHNVHLIYVNSGGGHRAAAEALCQSITEQRRPWSVSTFSIQDLLSSIDIVRQTTGVAFEDLYNIMLRRGWTAASGPLIPAMHLAIRLSHRAQVRVLERHWRAGRPDMVVSLIPHFNRALKESLERALPRTPLVTILTDIADYPPHFWIEPQEQYVVCGSERAEQQALTLGLHRDRVLRVSGMILHPRFHRALNLDRDAERKRLGLDPRVSTGLLLFGGEGSTEALEVVRSLNRADNGVQLIVLCGRNERVRRELEALPREIRMRIEGFTKAVDYYMELSDFFIGKPGPGCISEAAAKRLPVIVRCDARTLAHERYNCEWIREQGIGMVLKPRDSWFDAVREITLPENYGRFQLRLGMLQNRAVYEIPELLERILAESLGERPSTSYADGVSVTRAILPAT